MTMTNWYKAVKKFTSRSGDSWGKYLNFSKLEQAREIVSLDQCLCPPIFDCSNFNDEDWKHSVKQDYFCDFFLNLEHLLSLISSSKDINILSVILNPLEDCSEHFKDQRFEFCGYDLIEEGGGISALSNCGGFPLAFESKELNVLGLISEYNRVIEVSNKLRKHYPEESHASCDLWAIWRMK